MSQFELLLERASQEPFGIGVICTSAETADALKRLLYVKRAKAREQGNLAYDNLSLSFSPHAGDILYIYRKVEA
jgi:hypothetical protein